MPQPYNYNINTVDPLTSVLQGVSMARQQQAQAMAIEQQRMAMEAEKQKKMRQEEYQNKITALTENPFSSAQDYIKLQAQYPESIDAIKQVQQSRNNEQLQNDTEQVQKVAAALASGKNDIAKNQILEYRNALENSGRKNESAAMDNILEMMDQNPNIVSTELNKYLLAQMGPEAFTNYFNKLQTMQSGGRAQPVGGGIIIEDPNTHQKKLVTGSFQNGQLSIAGADLPGTLVSRLGETPEDVRTRTVQTTKEQEAAKLAQKRSAEYADRFDKINEGIITLDEAASVIKAGIERGDSLGQGAIMQYLPTIKQSTMELQSIANRLGLNIISSVTFGALSEGELKMAMSTGLPPGIKGQKLLDWVNKRRAAQQKLASYLSEASIYLGDHTVPEWMKYQKEQKRKKNEDINSNNAPTVEPNKRIEVQPGETTATNKKTGEKLVYRDGQWLNINTGAPIK